MELPQEIQDLEAAPNWRSAQRSTSTTILTAGLVLPPPAPGCRNR